MKLATFEDSSGTTRPGVVDGDVILPLDVPDMR